MSPVAVGDHVVHVVLGSQIEEWTEVERRQPILLTGLIDGGQDRLGLWAKAGSVRLSCGRLCEEGGDEKRKEQGSQRLD